MKANRKPGPLFRIWLSLFTALFFAFCASAHAWSIPWTGKKHAKPAKIPHKHGVLSESNDYQIVHFLTGSRSQKKTPRGKEDWVELGYKFASRVDNTRALFGPSGWASVRFLDRDGFVMAEQPFSFDHLIAKIQYYGFVWLEKSKAHEIKWADIKALKEAPASQNVENQHPEELADKLIQKVNAATQASETVTPPLTNASPRKVDYGSLSDGSFTNDEVDATLKKFDAKKPDEVPDSPETIPSLRPGSALSDGSQVKDGSA